MAEEIQKKEQTIKEQERVINEERKRHQTIQKEMMDSFEGVVGQAKEAERLRQSAAGGIKHMTDQAKLMERHIEHKERENELLKTHVQHVQYCNEKY